MKTQIAENYQGELTARYNYDAITKGELLKLRQGTVSEADHRLGIQQCEPLIVMMDCLIRYAKAHKAAFFHPLSEDCILGPEWLETAKGVRGLLNGNGAVAHFLGHGTDSKDNGAVESMFWSALSIAGFTEADL